MLTEERYAQILRLLSEKGAVTVVELTHLLNTSESTVRRDLSALHKKGRLYKVYGGATALESSYYAAEDDMPTKASLFMEEKTAIGRMAAALVRARDVVYIDAGTTTLRMIDFLTEKGATYITNGIPHAARLTERGFRAYILGGTLKGSTEAVVGSPALLSLAPYNFTKGFFGTNGISTNAGFSTPDVDEGALKGEALRRSKSAYVLADSSKFNRIAPVTFAGIAGATIITAHLNDKKYRDFTTVIEESDSPQEEIK